MIWLNIINIKLYFLLYNLILLATVVNTWIMSHVTLQAYIINQLFWLEFKINYNYEKFIFAAFIIIF